MIEAVVPPAFVEKRLGLADQTKNEPQPEPPADLLNLLKYNAVMAAIAPDYQSEEWLIRFTRRALTANILQVSPHLDRQGKKRTGSNFPQNRP